jgi:large subunit ribosomal protein L9
MKILLTQDVYKLGLAGEVKAVADGYGRNYLLPQGLGILATAGALKRAEALKHKALQKRAAEQAEVSALASLIDGKTVSFAVKAGEKGKLYGSVTAASIAQQLSALIGAEVDKRRIELREPIREVGAHVVNVRLATDVSPKVTVVVNPEGVLVSEAAAAPAPTAVVEEAAPAAA